MFDVTCPSHGGRVLLGDDAVIGITNSSLGIVVHWQCTCGALGRTVTGRRRSRPPDVTDARPDALSQAGACS